MKMIKWLAMITERLSAPWLFSVLIRQADFVLYDEDRRSSLTARGLRVRRHLMDG